MAGLVQSVEGIESKDKRFPEEGILPPDHKLENSPELQACCPGGFRLQAVHQFLPDLEKTLQQRKKKESVSKRLEKDGGM